MSYAMYGPASTVPLTDGERIVVLAVVAIAVLVFAGYGLTGWIRDRRSSLTDRRRR